MNPRPVLVVLALVAASACTHAPVRVQSAAARPPAADEFESGGFLVDEKSGEMYISATTVLVADEAKKREYDGLLEALEPGSGGGGLRAMRIRPLGGPSVSTIDEYIENLKKGDALNRAAFAKDHPGKEYYASLLDYEALRADLAAKAAGRRGVILRYIGTRKTAAKAAPEPRHAAERATSQDAQQAYLEGVIYYQKGDYEKARERWNEALRLKPGDSDTLAALAKIKKLYGD